MIEAQAIPKHAIAVSGNGKQVYAHLMQQPFSLSIGRNPHLISLLKEVISGLTLDEDHVLVEKNMGRNLGYGDIVETREKDVVFYAKPINKNSFTKFVKNRRTDSTTYLTFTLDKDEDDSYEVTDVWLGNAVPPFPDEPEATNESRLFWDDHAVVFNGQSVISGTITKDCPYENQS